MQNIIPVDQRGQSTAAKRSWDVRPIPDSRNENQGINAAQTVALIKALKVRTMAGRAGYTLPRTAYALLG